LWCRSLPIPDVGPRSEGRTGPLGPVRAAYLRSSRLFGAQRMLGRSSGAPESLGLDRFELGLGDRAAVKKLLGRLDLARRPGFTGSLADVLVELRLRRATLLFASLRHPIVIEDQVGQHTEPRKDHDDDHPRSLRPARDVATPEDIGEHDDRDPDEEDPRKDDEDVPEDAQEWIRRR